MEFLDYLAYGAIVWFSGFMLCWYFIFPEMIEVAKDDKEKGLYLQMIIVWPLSIVLMVFMSIVGVIKSFIKEM